MARLHILSGAQEGKVIELRGERISVGRAPSNLICLTDGLISTYQAMFVRDGPTYRLRDLNATNQTQVNEVAIRDTELHDGDRLRFGLVEMRFESEASPVPGMTAPKPPPPPPPRPKRRVGVLVAATVLILAAGVAVLGLWARRQTAPVPVAPRQPVVTKPAPAPVVKTVPVGSDVFTSPRLALANPPATNQLDFFRPAPPPAPKATARQEPVTPAAVVKPAPEKPAPPPAPASPTNIVQEVAAPVARHWPKPRVNPFEDPWRLAAATTIDQLVADQWQAWGIQPAPLCSDTVFIRRVYLDVIGTLPTAEEVRAFLDDRNPNKRNALIDQLLARDEFADYWALKWADLLRVKSEFPINLWPNAVQAYHRWIRTALRNNWPYDQFVRQLLTSSGSNFRVPPVNFYRAVQSKEPPALAQAVALTFMGTRADKWPPERLAGMAAFFAQVGYKSTAEWKEQIVFWDTGQTNAPAAAVFPDGTAIQLPADRDPRAVFADWLISPRNPWFTRTIVNRIWSWLLDRGIIQEPDDIRPDNPPSNPELLAYLERQLIAAHYDLKAIYRLILKSRTYQLSCVPRTTGPTAAAQFAYYPVRRLEAEVLIDALDQITGTTESYSSPIPEPFTFIPEDQRTIALADASISSPFLELFGRSPRDTGLESERNNRPSAAQRLHLLNSSHIQRKLEQGEKLRALLQTKGPPRALVDALYLTILSRYPTDEELKIVATYRQANADNRRVGLDLAWALINTAEFQYRH